MNFRVLGFLFAGGAAGFSVDVRAAADLVSSVRSYPDDTTSVIAVIPQVALPALASKCVQLQTALETHTGVILLGGTGTGKTTVLRTLAAAVQSLRNQWKKSDPYPEVLKRVSVHSYGTLNLGFGV